jgi:DNA invertase Pin-like site-specific DNA recombinase
MNLAAAYLRYSPRPRAAECESIESQRERVAAYAALAKLQITHTLEDPEISGGELIEDRPQGPALIALLKAKTVQHLIVQRLDRLSRNAADCIRWVEHWGKRGIALHLADQGGCSLDCSTATGQFMLGQLAIFATYERKLIGERTSHATRRHMLNGYLVTSKIPYGWMLDPEGGRRTADEGSAQRLVENYEEQQIIARMVSQRLAGESLRYIADFLNALLIPCRGGSRWHHSTVGAILRREKLSQNNVDLLGAAH